LVIELDVKKECKIMEETLLSPPIAFLIYIPLVALLSLLGRSLASRGAANPMKSSLYSSGEEAPTSTAVPGYQPFFLIALFFAILHLGILVVGSGGLRPMQGIYLLGLVFALVALMMG
jgi:NADH:ubiquinone oxidoreductase subunit 3 (subunit A)